MTCRGKAEGKGSRCKRILPAFRTYLTSLGCVYVPSCTVECAVNSGGVVLVTARVKGEGVKHCKGPEGSVFGSSGQHHSGLCVCVSVCGGELDSVTGFVGSWYFSCSVVCMAVRDFTFSVSNQVLVHRK